jgi:hypothetical protein
VCGHRAFSHTAVASLTSLTLTICPLPPSPPPPPHTHTTRTADAGVSQDLAHYALATTDLEYKFPFGWDELWGIANRGSYDLECHSRGSGIQLTYEDPYTKEVGTGRGRCVCGSAGGGGRGSLRGSWVWPLEYECAHR